MSVASPHIGISIHAPREGGDFVLFLFLLPVLRISIHAPREGGDLSSSCRGFRPPISIHAPREGGDCCMVK